VKPRVLQLLESFHRGGSERQAAQLVRLLHERNRYEIHVACLDADGVFRAEVESLGLGEIREYPLTSFHDRNAIAQVRRFARHLRDAGIEVVHTHGFYTNIFGMAAAALARVAMRVASRRETGGIRTGAQRRVERLAYRVANAIVANAEEVRRQLVAEGVPEGKVVTIHNGIDVDRVVPPAGVPRKDTLEMLGLRGDPERRFVTIVANMRLPVKDHPTFLRAARSVAAAVPGTEFVVAGGGPLAAAMRRLATELGVARSTHFIGECGRIAELLSVSQVCVLSSRAEGFSNSMLEYMAAARPVVATDVGGAREAIVEGESGYLVPAGDPEALASRVVSLLRDPERAAAMGRRGRRVVEERFSCAAQRARVEALYDAGLGARSP
jgi:L-malate glycosyltransferase